MEWLNKNYPNMRMADEHSFERYQFPPEVCDFIKTTWKMDGSVYHKPENQLNNTALHVLRTEGLDAAAKHMMSVSGDYARMRMEFG